MSNNSGYNVQAYVKDTEVIMLQILNNLTTKLDRIEETNDRRHASILNRIDIIEDKLSELCLNNQVYPSSFKMASNKISISSDVDASFFEFDEFYRRHFSQEIIESFYGPVTKSVCDLIR